MSDEAQLQQARSGNRDAFGNLQRLLEPSVARFVRKLIGRGPMEEDVVRETILALYMNLDRLDSFERVKPFLFRVARNLCYTELRRRGRYRILSLDEPSAESERAIEALADSRAPPDQQVQWILLWGEIQRGLDRLPEPQRQAMILYCAEDLSYAQIAEAMDTDIGT